jgi:hypothetical protein
VDKPTYSLAFLLKLKLETCEILSLVLIGNRGLDGGLKLIGGDGGRGRWLVLMALEFETSAIVNLGYCGWDINIDNFLSEWAKHGLEMKSTMG